MVLHRPIETARVTFRESPYRRRKFMDSHGMAGKWLSRNFHLTAMLPLSFEIRAHERPLQLIESGTGRSKEPLATILLRHLPPP
jgi:uncharacterized iron-regulated membrane protein